jgi:hypothetical protein
VTMRKSFASYLSVLALAVFALVLSRGCGPDDGSADPCAGQAKTMNRLLINVPSCPKYFADVHTLVGRPLEDTAEHGAARSVDRSRKPDVHGI